VHRVSGNRGARLTRRRCEQALRSMKASRPRAESHRERSCSLATEDVAGRLHRLMGARRFRSQGPHEAEAAGNGCLGILRDAGGEGSFGEGHPRERGCREAARLAIADGMHTLRVWRVGEAAPNQSGEDVGSLRGGCVGSSGHDSSKCEHERARRSVTSPAMLGRWQFMSGRSASAGLHGCGQGQAQSDHESVDRRARAGGATRRRGVVGWA